MRGETKPENHRHEDKGNSKMAISLRLTTVALVTAALAGCAGNSERPSDSGGSGTPGLAEQACLRDVTRTTNNPDVVLLDSSYSEAGTEVIVGVGPQRARWRCIGYSDGTTTGIMSLTDEGRL